MRIWSLSIFLFIGLWIASSTLSAENFSYRLLSEETGERKEVQRKYWEVRIYQETAQKREVLKFFVDNSGIAVCEVKKSIPLKPGSEIHLKTRDGVFEKNTEDLLVIPEFSVPCNILPIYQKVKEKEYINKKKAGGRLFAQKYTVKIDEISQDQYRQSEWLKDPLVVAETLTLFTVLNDRHEILVRQLWDLSDKWWIYEETPNKRSWRIQ